MVVKHFWVCLSVSDVFQTIPMLLQYMTIYPACLGPEGCWIGVFSGIWVASPRMYKK
jgi:hypothetical protein